MINELKPPLESYWEWLPVWFSCRGLQLVTKEIFSRTWKQHTIGCPTVADYDASPALLASNRCHSEYKKKWKPISDIEEGKVVEPWHQQQPTIISASSISVATAAHRSANSNATAYTAKSKTCVRRCAVSVLKFTLWCVYATWRFDLTYFLASKTLMVHAASVCIGLISCLWMLLVSYDTCTWKWWSRLVTKQTRAHPKLTPVFD